MNASTIKISNRETEILKLMSDGYTSKEIGKQLYISNLTVDKHKRNMLTKFNARNSVQLVVHAERLGLLNENEEVNDYPAYSVNSTARVIRHWTDISLSATNS